MMRIAIGNDHAGYEMKLHLIEQLRQADYDVTDFGTHSTESVDYPDYAAAVAAAILDEQVDRGIVVCGTGVGVAIAANKVKGIRAAQASDIYTAHQAVEHNDVNVLALAGKIVGDVLAWEMVKAFLNAEFAGEERLVRRVQKLAQLESE
ncbi:MAG: RpiB/LacA/LacB family sugar-phosphate isomerase [Candidatus Poriferisodalaceae bacterium]|jgi:RpiB/LacA/LacB family sugar-phosphate isomerase